MSQKVDWHIGDVIPGLIVIINCSLVEGLRGEKKNALLNTSKLYLWFKQEYAKDFTNQALESAIETVFFFLDDKSDENISNSPEQTASIPTTSYSNNENRIFQSLLRAKAYETPQDVARLTRKDQIKKETDLFLQLLNDRTTFAKSTQAFWSEFSNKLPILSQVALKIFCIPASSAFIERYFSICGLFNNKRSINIKPENFIDKVMFRVNIDLLDRTTTH
ncbi:hypothetical protein BpHYR1_011108 [Brachionus plicatilis]|uniref:HAT C-terminal dimerisation domain-containing protein n=1 Tax=Brachionus plicatilis TaxID=10195 RepID=A0A3M7PVW8_BRAPC|nr:hypothetical protein BpHYR1_011108 [Brachionus plicatilis]